LKWDFVIYNLGKDTQYYDGVYMGKILFPSEYPLKPPDVIFQTPNGRFEVNKKICLSFTSFHPESWANWCVESMLVGLISFMVTEEPTTGAINCSTY
jgi:ubiquitin-conjugating enzyme E2 J2